MNELIQDIKKKKHSLLVVWFYIALWSMARHLGTTDTETHTTATYTNSPTLNGTAPVRKYCNRYIA